MSQGRAHGAPQPRVGNPALGRPDGSLQRDGPQLLAENDAAPGLAGDPGRGARSGRLRSTPVLGIPLGDTLAVAGLDFGQQATPGWVHNLLAHPEAEVGYRRRRARVKAREATDDEYLAAVESAAIVYPPTAQYIARSTGRPIHVFVLEPLG